MELCVQMWAVRTFLMVNPFVTCMTVLWKLCMSPKSHGVDTLENVFNNKQGWNKFEAAHHTAAKEAFLAWVQMGRLRKGPVLEYKKHTNARYKLTSMNNRP